MEHTTLSHRWRDYGDGDVACRDCGLLPSQDNGVCPARNRLNAYRFTDLVRDRFCSLNETERNAARFVYRREFESSKQTHPNCDRAFHRLAARNLTVGMMDRLIGA